MTRYQIHLLLLPPHNELDELTMMESIQDLLLQGSQWSNDNVVVELDTITTSNNDQQHYYISIIYDDAWKTQIHFAEGTLILHEAQAWARIHALDLPIHARNAIGASFKRLNITSDPDNVEDEDYTDFFLAILVHLQGNFTPCYLFDAVQDKFIL